MTFLLHPLRLPPVRTLLRAALLACVSCSLIFAAPGSEKLAPELRPENPRSTVDVIIQYRVVPVSAHHQRVNQLGGRLRHEFQSIRGAHYTVPASSLADLANDPDVIYISPDRAVQGLLNYTAVAVRADVAHSSGYTGEGVTVAVIDSGIADIQDFHGGGNHLVYQESFIGGTAADQYGHGTHVAGILAASGANGYSLYQGIAPGVDIVNLRVLDKNGSGTDSAVIAAINRAIQLRSQYNIRVINLSLGRPVTVSYQQDPLCQAVEAAWNAGIVVVAAAGNDGRNNTLGTNGYSTISVPGNDPSVITVGAMKTMGTYSTSDDQIASYSSKGPTLLDHVVKPDIMAPGNHVVSVLPAGLTLSQLYPTNSYPGGHFQLSGTSMATPVVSAAAALLLAQQPSLSPDQVKAMLMKGASKNLPSSSSVYDPVTGKTYTSYNDIFTVGAGYLDIIGTLWGGFYAQGSARSPTATWDSVAKRVTLTGVSGTNVVWGNTSDWSPAAVWGANAVSGVNVVWGNNVVWGSGTVSGFNVVWGQHVVWGQSGAVADAAKMLTGGEN